MVSPEACIFATVMIGFLGLIYKRNLLMKIVAMDVISTGVIAYYCFVAARTGVTTPIVGAEVSPGPIQYADPLPQAVILTAIVIGFSTQILMLVIAMKLAKENPTLEIAAIEREYWP